MPSATRRTKATGRALTRLVHGLAQGESDGPMRRQPCSAFGAASSLTHRPASAPAPDREARQDRLRVIGRNEQRSAISTVDARASGISANSTAISARDLKR